MKIATRLFTKLRPTHMLSKLGEHGFSYCARRLVEELRRSRKRTQPPAHEQDVRDRVRQHLREDYRGQRLLAIYDFIDLPYSYDIATFYVNAEIERRRRGCDKIDVAFVSHESDPGPPRHAYVNTNNFRQYLHNLALEITRVTPHVGSVFLFNNRMQFQDFLSNARKTHCVFPADYATACPVAIRNDRPLIHSVVYGAAQVSDYEKYLCLRPPDDQVQLARKWIMANVWPNIPVTITLREWDSRMPLRNSNLAEWQKLVDSYRGQNLTFIVLRDYHKLYDPPALTGDNVVHFNEAVVSSSLRAAVYQECATNLLVSNGCGALAIFNTRVRYTIFKFSVLEQVATAEKIKLRLGLDQGDDFYGANKFQKLIWEPDTFEVMKPHLDATLALLRADGCLVPDYYKDTGSHSASNTQDVRQTGEGHLASERVAGNASA